MLFTLSIVAFVCLLLLCEAHRTFDGKRTMAHRMLTARAVAVHPAALWTFRVRLIEYLPDHIAARFRDYAPVGTFEAAMEGGFMSSNFDLSGNIEDDQRQGLDEVGHRVASAFQVWHAAHLSWFPLTYLTLSAPIVYTCGAVVSSMTGRIDRSQAYHGYVSSCSKEMQQCAS